MVQKGKAIWMLKELLAEMLPFSFYSLILILGIYSFLFQFAFTTSLNEFETGNLYVHSMPAPMSQAKQ